MPNLGDESVEVTRWRCAGAGRPTAKRTWIPLALAATLSITTYFSCATADAQADDLFAVSPVAYFAPEPWQDDNTAEDIENWLTEQTIGGAGDTNENSGAGAAATTTEGGQQPSRNEHQSDEKAGDEKGANDEKNKNESNDEKDSDGAEGDEDEKSLTDRLKDLEKNYEKLEKNFEELDEGLDEGISGLKSTLKGYARSGHSGATMKVSGRIHADHWAFPGDSPGVNAFETGDPTISPQDRLGFRRIRFGMAGGLWYNTEYKIEMEFAGANDVEYRDVYIGINELPLLHTLLIGNQKRPYGLDHINSSRYNVFLERPFVIEGFNQDSRRLGIASYGVSENERWNWRYGLYNQTLVQAIGSYVSDHYQPELTGRLANTIWYDEGSDGRGYAHWAISGSLANPDGSGLPGRAANAARFRTRPESRTASRWLDTGAIAGADNFQLLGLESVLNVGPTQLVGEFQHIWLDRDPGSQLQFHGAYMYLSYFLTGEHIPWERDSGQLGRVIPHENFFAVRTCDGCRARGWGAWQVAFRWSYADFTDRDILGGIGESYTLAVNWHWNPYAKMQFNYGYGEISNHAPVAGQTFGTYQFLGTRFVVDF